LKKKTHTEYYYSLSVFSIVGKTQNIFVFLDLLYFKRFRFCIT